MASVQPCATSSAIFRLGLRGEQRVLLPPFGLVDVLVGGDDVVIADQQRRDAAVEQVLGVRLQAFEPGELVVELGARPGIAVGGVEVADENPANRGLDVAALLEVGVVGQGAAGLDRLADPAEDRDSVPAALAVPDGGIAERFDGVRRERLIGALQFLDAGYVGRELREPAGQHVEPAVDAVDVGARDPQATLFGHLCPTPLGAIRFCRRVAQIIHKVTH